MIFLQFLFDILRFERKWECPVRFAQPCVRCPPEDRREGVRGSGSACSSHNSDARRTARRVQADIAMFVALLAIWVPGIIDTRTALSGYSNPGLITVVALFVVVFGVQKLPLLKKAANFAFGRPTHGRVALLKQILVVATFSVFM